MTWLTPTPYPVTIQKLDFIDPARNNRQVPIKIYTPQTHEPHLPTIIWSHGLGGSRDGAAFLARYLAEQGFILVHVTHRGTDTTLWEGKDGHPWDVIRATTITRKATLQRFQDIPFVMNELVRRQHEEPFHHIDFSRLGMSGHSFGAVTTQVMAGQQLGRGKRFYSLKDHRFKCGIAYSLGPTYNHDQNPQDIYGTISIPMLYMTGTLDDSPLNGRGYEERLPIYEHASGTDQHLLVLNEGDHMVFAGSRGGLKDTPKRAVHEGIIQKVSLAFWQAYLNDQPDAKDWLHGSGITQMLQDEALWSTRNLS